MGALLRFCVLAEIWGRLDAWLFVQTLALYLKYVAGAEAARVAEVRRQTKETRVLVSVNLDGTGVCTSNSQIPFLDHMMDVRPNAVPSIAYFASAGPAARQSGCPCCCMPVTYALVSLLWMLLSWDCVAYHAAAEQRTLCPQQLASHGLFNVIVEAEGDTWIDDHHTNEDIGNTSSGKLAFVGIRVAATEGCHAGFVVLLTLAVLLNFSVMPVSQAIPDDQHEGQHDPQCYTRWFGTLTDFK